MCGIVGIIGPNADALLLEQMLSAQKHRGPDFQDKLVCISEVALGHNRLSIIDLSAAANQPFHSNCQRFSIVFNGEIYNYLELRKTLQSKYDFTTQSDTEVLLYAYIEWGKEALDKLNGMFAFAIWDAQEKSLFAARDRFGVKPFYYSIYKDSLFFASEIPALFAATIPKEANTKVWASYLSSGHYGNPEETFWNNIHALKPGHYLQLQHSKLTCHKWYDFVSNVNAMFSSSALNEEEYITALLNDAIQLRFRADVPVGFNLSGGLDSSILLALIHHQFPNNNSIEAFTFFTNDERYDELSWVKQMLSDKKYPLNKCLLSPTEVPTLAKNISDLQAEPYGGIPTLAYSKVFQAARAKGIKVLLDGQGSDEAWAGYDYYLQNSSAVIQGVSNSPFRPVVLQPDFLQQVEKIPYDKPFKEDLLNLQYRDLFFTKIPRALRFNDRVSMLHGTELREPFLDYRLVEYVFSRPKEFKIKEGVQKWLLRKMANQYLQKEVALAPKRPLQTPQREWLANELQDWVRSEVMKLNDQEWFDKKALQKELESYFQGNQQSSFHIWQWISAAMLLKK